MAWIALLASAILEAVWATALGHSDGLREPLPTTVFAIALTASMLGLGWAARRIPIGTAYAIWTGLGAALTVSYAALVGDEPLTPAKLLFVGVIVAAAVGLKLVPTRAPGPTPAPDTVTR